MSVSSFRGSPATTVGIYPRLGLQSGEKEITRVREDYSKVGLGGQWRLPSALLSDLADEIPRETKVVACHFYDWRMKMGRGLR